MVKAKHMALRDKRFSINHKQVNKTLLGTKLPKQTTSIRITDI